MLLLWLIRFIFLILGNRTCLAVLEEVVEDVEGVEVVCKWVYRLLDGEIDVSNAIAETQAELETQLEELNLQKAELETTKATLEAAMAFGEVVETRRIRIRNKTEIFKTVLRHFSFSVLPSERVNQKNKKNENKNKVFLKKSPAKLRGIFLPLILMVTGISAGISSCSK